jgi:hypothetical protein
MFVKQARFLTSDYLLKDINQVFNTASSKKNKDTEFHNTNLFKF